MPSKIRFAEYDQTLSQKDFWEDQEKAQRLLRERARLQDEARALEGEGEGVGGDPYPERHCAGKGEDQEDMDELGRRVETLDKALDAYEIERMLGEENDKENAIVYINAGAGGTEAQDWAEMLLRMYLKWAEKKGFSRQVVDLLPGDEAGVKNVTLILRGAYAYGYMKCESGIHRLVRISPFDANARRHTSFASVYSYPELPEDIQVDIREEDLRIDTFRSSGPGGQHVNRTESAIRITHLPTGIVVQCQNERSQHKNKAIAMAILKSRIYELEKRKKGGEDSLRRQQGEEGDRVGKPDPVVHASPLQTHQGSSNETRGTTGGKRARWRP